MAEVYPSPTVLGKRAHLHHEACEPPGYAPSACKRMRSFDMTTSPQRPPWPSQGLDFGANGWPRTGGDSTQGAAGAGGGPFSPAPSHVRRGFMGTGGDGRPADMSGELAAKDAEIQKLRDVVMEKDRSLRGVVDENYKLKHACVQAEATIATLVNDSKILKRGINVQQQKCAKLEEEVGQLKAYAAKAVEHINKLEQANRSLCFRAMQSSSGSCHDFIQHQGPPDVF